MLQSARARLLNTTHQSHIRKRLCRQPTEGVASHHGLGFEQLLRSSRHAHQLHRLRQNGEE